MIKKTLLILTFSSYLLANVVSQEKIDTKKPVIQIASSKSLKKLKEFSKRFEDLDQDIFIRNYKQKYYILYAVNIEPQALKQVLKSIKEKSPSAFATKELSKYLKALSFISTTKPTITERKASSYTDAIAPIQLLDIHNIYQKAIYAYNNKEYKEAYEYFSLYSKENSMDKRGNFLFARSAFELDSYRESLSIYDKILLQDPNNVRVELEIGQCYFRLGEYKKAKDTFNKVLQTKLPDNVKLNVLAMLKAIETKSEKHFTQAMIQLSYVYDSNVDNSADAGDYNIYIPSLNSNILMSNSGEKTSDSSIEAIAALTHKYKINDELVLETKGTAFTQQYFDEHDKDIDLLALEIGLAKYTKESKITVAFGYSYIWLDSSSYMDIPSLKISYDKKLSPTLTYQGYLKLADKDYLQIDNKDRDSNVYEFYNSLSLTTQDYGTNTLSLTLGKEDKVRGIRTDVNKNYYALNMANNYSISQTLLLKSSLDYKISDYKDTDVNFLTKRKDKQTTVTMGLMKSINKSITLGTNLQWIDNSSNHEPFDYDKYVLKGFFYYGF